MDSMLDILVLITTISVFYVNMDFRFSNRKVLFAFTVFGALSFSLYMFLLQIGYDREVISSICFSIPSFVLCFWLSKYRDARFIFTFAAIDLIAFAMVILGRVVSIPFGYANNVIFVATSVLLGFYLIGAILFKNKYLEILRTVSSGWGYLASAVISMYVFTFFLVGYPTPLYTRREYVPTILVYLVVVVIFLKVIYEAARNNIKIYIESIEKENLKMRLELNRVYYNMAYTDGLSGLKNRNAFEEDLLEFEKQTEKPVVCISFDINNLKCVNDEIGHHAGDELIKQVGNMLREVFPDEKCVYRIGGDEFIAIIENKSEPWAFDKFKEMDVISERIRQEIKLPFEYARGKCCGNASSIRTLIQHADEAMYIDKDYHKARKRDGV